MAGVIAAGMQAGSAIAEPLTFKRPTITNIRNDASWTVSDNASELIDSGLMMLERVDGVGIRWIRSITTHLADDNLVFVEMSSNESLNHCAYNLRQALELFVGKRGLVGAAGSIQVKGGSELDNQVRDETIVAWRNMTVEQIGDVYPVSVEVAPVNPINFVPITIHVVASNVSA
jgi:hypothetical protein